MKIIRHTCRRCRRLLFSDKAQRAGIGKTCAAKEKRQTRNQLKLELKSVRHGTK